MLLPGQGLGTSGGGAGGPAGAQGGGAAAAAGQAVAGGQQGAGAADFEAESAVSTMKPGAAGGKKKGAANWKSKHVIIDAINELIEELENITTSITVQVSQRVHDLCAVLGAWMQRALRWSLHGSS